MILFVKSLVLDTYYCFIVKLIKLLVIPLEKFIRLSRSMFLWSNCWEICNCWNLEFSLGRLAGIQGLGQQASRPGLMTRDQDKCISKLTRYPGGIYHHIKSLFSTYFPHEHCRPNYYQTTYHINKTLPLKYDRSNILPPHWPYRKVPI